VASPGLQLVRRPQREPDALGTGRFAIASSWQHDEASRGVGTQARADHDHGAYGQREAAPATYPAVHSSTGATELGSS
jgi:hypothetical protein